MAVRPIPTGYRTVTPYLICKGAAQAIDFYTRAFGAKELMRLAAPGGQIGHAEIEIGDSRIMLADACEEAHARDPHSLGGTPVSILLYVEDVDTVYNQAVASGATEVRPLMDQFYGDRSGVLTDPFGHMWCIATHVEDVAPEEINRRFESYAKQQAPA